MDFSDLNAAVAMVSVIHPSYRRKGIPTDLLAVVILLVILRDGGKVAVKIVRLGIVARGSGTRRARRGLC